MAEIKSAIELAMERTKGLVMDEGEKEQSARREAEGRLQALIRRYTEGMIDIDRFRGQFEDFELAEPIKRSMAIDLITGQLDLAGESEGPFAMLHACCGHIGEALMRELDDIRQEFDTAMGHRTEDVRARVMQRLAGMGISGSAVEPNLTEWDEWKEAADETRELFSKRLAAWTGRVKALQA